MKTNNQLAKHSAAIAAAITMTGSPLSAKTAKVTNSGDSGTGTFRAAVEEANTDDSIKKILFSPKIGTVALQSSVTYHGGQRLEINGKNVVIEPAGEGSFDLLVSDGGGDLSLQSMTLQNSGGGGVMIDVPEDAFGQARVTLFKVTLADNALEGILIDDCDGPDLKTCGGSDAGVDLRIFSSTITENGRSPGVSDIDGIRINERGLGDVLVSIHNSNIDANGGDGIEVEEGDEGVVDLIAHNSTFNDNGDQDLEDPEDGIDIDERGEGSLLVSLVNVTVEDCFDEGIDLNEDDGGDIDARFLHVTAVGAKSGDGIRCREDGDGSVFVDAKQIIAAENDDEGIQLSEEGEGDLIALLQNVESSDNDDHGMQLEESDGGSLDVQLTNVLVDFNNDDGVQIEEKDDGNFLAAILNSIISNSAKYGIKAEQDDDGEGQLSLTNVELSNNEDGDLDLDGVVLAE